VPLVLASNLDLIAPQLSKYFEVTPKTIYHWFTLWEIEGINDLVKVVRREELVAISKEDLKSLLVAPHSPELNLIEIFWRKIKKYNINIFLLLIIKSYKKL
jgi:hypothetical protein